MPDYTIMESAGKIFRTRYKVFILVFLIATMLNVAYAMSKPTTFLSYFEVRNINYSSREAFASMDMSTMSSNETPMRLMKSKDVITRAFLKTINMTKEQAKAKMDHWELESNISWLKNNISTRNLEKDIFSVTLNHISGNTAITFSSNLSVAFIEYMLESKQQSKYRLRKAFTERLSTLRRQGTIVEAELAFFKDLLDLDNVTVREKKKLDKLADSTSVLKESLADISSRLDDEELELKRILGDLKKIYTSSWPDVNVVMMTLNMLKRIRGIDDAKDLEAWSRLPFEPPARHSFFPPKPLAGNNKNTDAYTLFPTRKDKWRKLQKQYISIKENMQKTSAEQLEAEQTIKAAGEKTKSLKLGLVERKEKFFKQLSAFALSVDVGGKPLDKGITADILEYGYNGTNKLARSISKGQRAIQDKLGRIMLDIESRESEYQIINMSDTAKEIKTLLQKKTIGLILLTGLILAAGAAYMMELLSQRGVSIETIEEILEEKTLVELPNFYHIKTQVKVDFPDKLLPVVFHTGYLPLVNDLFRITKARIIRKLGKKKMSIVITSPTAQEGKSTCTGNLAVAFAEMGFKTLICSCNLRQPTLEKAFGLPESAGVNDILCGDVYWKETVCTTGVMNLYMIPSGRIPSDSSKLIYTREFEEFQDEITENFDIVLYDTPPLTLVVDTQVITSRCDGMLLVVSPSKENIGLLKQTKKIIDGMQLNLLGVIANNSDLGYQFNGYGKVSSYGYGAKKQVEKS